MRFKNIIIIALISIGSGLASVGIYKVLENEKSRIVIAETTPFAQYTTMNKMSGLANQPVDFTMAAAITTPAVVHVKTTYNVQNNNYQNHPYYDFFKELFGEGNPNDQFGTIPPKIAMGSGVIIEENGYIVTNNHMVENGDNVEVVLSNNRSFSAEVIGTDPSTDLAVIKIDAKELPTILYTSSDDVRIGEWVLAVGNPFNFSSTVTAGIVSAKGRNIDILKDKMPIESFIQTDAAVNKGNSGGALVNVQGKLIGINTAIVSPSGTYAGYSFAIPSNIVEKVVNDLIDFGMVQRGLLGISIVNMNADLAKKLDVSITQGILIENVLPGSSAEEAGLENGDIITSINNIKVNNVSELQEQVARQRPGDKIDVIYLRHGRTLTTNAILKNLNNTTEIMLKDNQPIGANLGADFRELTSKEKSDFNINSGIIISKLHNGILKDADMKEGFIITNVAERDIDSKEDLAKVLKNKSGNITFKGIYPGQPGMYYYILKYNER